MEVKSGGWWNVLLRGAVLNLLQYFFFSVDWLSGAGKMAKKEMTHREAFCVVQYSVELMQGYMACLHIPSLADGMAVIEFSSTWHAAARSRAFASFQGKLSQPLKHAHVPPFHSPWLLPRFWMCFLTVWDVCSQAAWLSQVEVPVHRHSSHWYNYFSLNIASSMAGFQAIRALKTHRLDPSVLLVYISLEVRSHSFLKQF